MKDKKIPAGRLLTLAHLQDAVTAALVDGDKLMAAIFQREINRR